MSFLAISSFMSIVGGATSILGGVKAKKDAREQARIEAKLEGIVTESKIAGLEAEERELAGQTRASAVGSGVSATVGSPLQLLAEQARNFQREKKTVLEAGATRATQAQTRGRMVGNQAMYSGLSQGFQSFGNAFSLMGG